MPGFGCGNRGLCVLTGPLTGPGIAAFVVFCLVIPSLLLTRLVHAARACITQAPRVVLLWAYFSTVANVWLLYQRLDSPRQDGLDVPAVLLEAQDRVDR